MIKKINFIFICCFILIAVQFLGNTNLANAEDNGKTIENGTYVIISAINNDYVLDVSNAAKFDRANVQIWKNANVSQQRFKVEYLNNGYYKITSENSGKVLDVDNAGKYDETNVQQYSYNGTDAQLWQIKDVGNGYYSLVSKCSGKYLDISGGIASNGRNIQIYTSNGTNAQKFKIEKYTNGSSNNQSGNSETPKKTIDNGTYVFKSAINKDYVLDVSNAAKFDRANVQIWKNANVSQQRFKVEYLNNGYYKITSENSGKVLDVDNAGKYDETNVQQYSYNGTDAQLWQIKDVGNGYYSLVSKCSGKYLDVSGGIASNGRNIQIYTSNGTNAQKFKLEKYATNNGNNNNGATQTKPDYNNKNNGNSQTKPGKKNINSGLYAIKTYLNQNYVIDVSGGSKNDSGNIQIWQNSNVPQQKFSFKKLNNGYYLITSCNSGKVLDVYGGYKKDETNVQQYSYNGTDAQQWEILNAGSDFCYIKSKLGEFYLTIDKNNASNGSNISIRNIAYSNAQKFKLEKVNFSIDNNKYPGYADKIKEVLSKHPNWNIEIVYTGLTFDEVVDGEYAYRGTNLVPSSYQGEWIDSTKTYDTGSWYGASRKAIAYYIDPRNFLDENNIFQFLDVNRYDGNSVSYDGIRSKVNKTYLNDYANDINQACANTGVNPYYVIARLLQEQGNKGGSTWRMNDNGKYYYNPFNIGATGNGSASVIQNALTYAKNHGWDTMEKAVESGISFLKANWLDNYQNTLYTNKFDIDIRSGNGQKSGLYAHQYMGNLMAAYSEALILRSSYKDTGKLDSNFTFYIPVYESMNSTISPMPSSNSESKITNVRTTGTKVNMRSDATTNSSVITMIENKGTVLLSIERGINQNWQKVCTTDGKIGYIRGDLLEQIDDVKTCNYSARIKTNDGDGCYGRYAPTKSVPAIYPCFSEGTTMTVIDNSTYKNIDGYDWYRVILSNGTQAFFPGKYIAAN